MKIVNANPKEGELKDISFFEYSQLEGEEREEYNFAIKYGELDEFDLFEIGEFEDNTFDFVKSFQYFLNTTDEHGKSLFTFEKYLELIIDYKSISKDYIAKQSIFKLIQSYNYAIKELKLINEKENIHLSHKPTAEEKRASEGLFVGMSVLIQQKKLSKIMIISFQEVEKIEYNLCFALLKLDIEENQFKREYAKIVNS